MMAEKNDFKQKPILGVIAWSVALAAGLFCLTVSILLIADHVRLLQMDPLNDPVLLDLRSQLADSTGDSEALVEQVRAYDFYARRAFFSNAEQRRTGGLLLCGGAFVCFLALGLGCRLMPCKPQVGGHESINHGEMNSLFRQLMAGTGIFLGAVALFLAFAVKSDLAVVLARRSDSVTAPSADAPVVQDVLSRLPDAFAVNWPSLRGAGNVGAGSGGEFPIQWDIESGEGVLWSVEVPVMGFNSPIVWEGRIFLTGADEEGQEVFCYDVDSGEMLWTRTIESSVELPIVAEDTGYAAPTMASDGTRVFAIFASGELAAFDMDGNPVWQKNIGTPENPYGMGSSLISDGQRLFVQYDHSDRQRVLAFDGASGELLWETPREHISWASPSLIEFGERLLMILNDELNVTAYDPASGDALWQVECLGGEVAPSATFNGQDILFVGNEYAQATALRLTDSDPEILWQYDEFLPEIASPLATAERVYIPTTAGDIVCLNIHTGEVLWEQEFDDGFSSSPVLAGGRIYAADLSGIVHIFDDADVYHSVADITMGEAVFATPAFTGNRIVIRGDYNLFCIGEE